MHSLMIVDDEPIVLRAISHVVESHCPDIQVVAKTGNGIEAVTLALERKPDIIFMDIELAGVNGLEAIAEIKKSLPETVVVIISAYDNFKYAQKSIALGVVDYLLKPVSKDDLMAILAKAAGRLEEQRGKTREQMELRGKVSKMRSFLEEDLFFSLLYPSLGMHPLLEYPQLLELEFNLGQAVEIYVEDCNRLGENFSRFRQLVRNCLKGAKTILFSPLIGRNASILLGYEAAPADPKASWEEVRRLLETDLQISAGIILGEVLAGYEGMLRSFNNLRRSLQLMTYPPGVYYPTDLPEPVKTDFSISYLFEQRFFEAVKAGQKELAGLMFLDLHHFIQTALAGDLQSQKDYFQGIIAVLLRIFNENTAEETRQSLSGNTFSQRIRYINDFQELEITMAEIVTQLTEGIQKKGNSEKNPEIRVALEYMEKNYDKEITLTDIAAAAAISPGYLSKLFKEYRNQTVMDLLERIRIEEALNLLKQSTLSIKEIALKVGYRDPNYFSKVFKKVTNLPPTAIRS